MYTNNLILDRKGVVKIPQNYQVFFNIELSSKIKDSLEISIFPDQEIDVFNLYIIIKSYVSNLIFIPSNFLIVVDNKDGKEFIASNINVSEFKNISLSVFSNWFYRQMHRDWEYIKKEGRYSFIFTYPIKIYDEADLAYLRPNYPWKSEILHKMSNLIDSELKYEDIIEKQKKEIEKLKEEIELIKKGK